MDNILSSAIFITSFKPDLNSLSFFNSLSFSETGIKTSIIVFSPTSAFPLSFMALIPLIIISHALLKSTSLSRSGDLAMVIKKVPNNAPDDPPIPDRTFIAIIFKALANGKSLIASSSSTTNFKPL